MSLSPKVISSVAVVSFSLMIGTTPHSSSFASVRRAFTYCSRADTSKKVSSTCAALTSCSPSRPAYTSYSGPCPTADAACSSSIADGRTGIPMRRMPSAIAPEVTSVAAPPSVWTAPTWRHTSRSTSARTSPASSATSVEPSFTTVSDIYCCGTPGYRANATSPISISSPASNPCGLESLEDTHLLQPLLDVGERLGIVEVVAADQPLDRLAAQAERAVRAALDLQPSSPGR